MLPTKSWDTYDDLIRRVGERRPEGTLGDLSFLCELGLIEDNGCLQLSEVGGDYFRARFISSDDDLAMTILRRCVLQFPPAAAIVQFLAGVPNADRARTETVLRNQGFGDDLTERKLGTLLMMMNHTEVISYISRTGRVTVLVQPAQDIEPPSSIFVSPRTPYGNRAWIRRILGECNGFIYWLDKHFMPQAFEPIWEIADGVLISEVRIISLQLSDNSGKSAIRDYQNLRTELKGRSVDMEWRFIDSTAIRDTHDRWIIGSETAWNVPNVNAIFSGQHSELCRSDQHAELGILFNRYWLVAHSVA